MNIMALRNIFCVSLLLIWLHCATGMDLLFSCNFGTNIAMNENFCSMVQGVDDDFDWKLTASSEKADTGPTQDHTGNTGGTGRFLWADSDNGAPGQKAAIATPPFNLTGDEGWLTFWYHLYGDGLLEISVCQDGEANLTFVGDQRNEWQEHNMTVSCGDTPVQITFTSTISSSLSDVGVDDIFLYHLLQTTTDRVTTSMTESHATTNDPATSPGLTSSFTTIAGFTTETDESLQSSTSLSSPLPRKGSGPALPISLSVVAIFFVAALLIVICFIRKRRQQPEKPIAMESVHKYDNHAYSSNMNDVLDNTTDTRRNTNSTFDSSTWRSAASTMNGTGVNDTLGGSQPPNRSSQASSASGSGVQGEDSEGRHYFVLNPGRASMLVENGEEEARNPYDPVALYDNKPERYTYIENDGSSIAMTTGDAGEVGMEDNGYDPVTIKDDTTGGYQYVDDTGAPVANGCTNHGDVPSPYESVAIGEASSKSNKSNAEERKIPIPAARKNIAPKPKERMVDNVLYKPLNGEKMVDNVLYNPI